MLKHKYAHTIHLLIILLGFILMSGMGQAQTAFSEYSWETPNIALAYPQDWDVPVANSGGPREFLQMAQGFVDDANNRPPAIPVVNIIVSSEAIDNDSLFGFLADAMQSVIGIEAKGALPADWLGFEAVGTLGTDETGDLFGIGRIVQLDDGRTLLMVGRSGAVLRDDFTVTFDLIADSVILSADREPLFPEYGIRWVVEQSPVDGDSAFINLGALALAPDGNTLYAADEAVGLVQLDATTGLVLETTPFVEETLPTALAIRPDGTIYVGDVLCQCVRVVRDGQQQQTLDNFGDNAPRSVAWLDGTFYATDFAEDSISVLAVSDARIGRIMFPDPLEQQPLLTVNRRGELLALVDDRAIYVLENEVFTYSHDLSMTLRATAIAIDAQNNLVVATDRMGIIRFDDEGAEVDRIGFVAETTPPLPGEMSNVVGLAANINGAIYWADSNGDYGLITASELGVEVGRIGLTNLTAGVPVQGALDETLERQIWTFDAQEGESISLTALAIEESGDLDVALRLLAPDGTEVMYQTEDATETLENGADVRLASLTLEQSGRYTLLVEREFGVGRYRLGFDRARPIALEDNTTTTVKGEISDLFPTQNWVFDGNAGQTLTITMEAQSGNLDTMLTLANADGDLIADNDDADDLDLGTNSQIVQVLLPFGGEYIIEAARFVGTGRYTLTVTVE